MFAADLDSDGDLEVVSSAGECVIGRCVREIVWYENIDERGTFGPQKLIQDDDGYVEPVGVADVDGDGDFDILTRHTDGIGWYQNTDGFGQFSEPHIIFAARGDVQSVADVDGDGDLDLLSRLRLERRGMGWLENIDGKGTFSEPHMIVTTTTNIGEFFLDPRSMTFADVDGDRDMDVVWSGRECERVASNSSSCFSTVFAWHENTDGRGNFGPQFIIPNVLVSGNAESLQVADVDGDGDMDIVSDRTWHVNTDGSGHFGPGGGFVMRRSYQSVEPMLMEMAMSISFRRAGTQRINVVGRHSYGTRTATAMAPLVNKNHTSSPPWAKKMAAFLLLCQRT